MHLPGMTFPGAPVDDPAILDQIPGAYAQLLAQRNGFVAFNGALHVRGAVRGPAWHSLREAIEGPGALHRLFGAVTVRDVPLGQDAFGDQYLLRDDSVVRLRAETGDLEPLQLDLAGFLTRVLDDPEEALDLADFVDYRAGGGVLAPGYLLATLPFRATAEAREALRCWPMPALERVAMLADLARQLAGAPDGTRLHLTLDRPRPEIPTTEP